MGGRKYSGGEFRYVGGNVVRRWNGEDHVLATVVTRLAWHENASCSYDEADANGRLFAAAPELLEALRYIVRVHQVAGVAPENQPHEISEALTAIAKASGESAA